MAKKVNSLYDALKSTGLRAFNPSTNALTYKTGFPVLDYHLGYLVNVYDDDDNVIDTYPALGITAGCFVTFIGKPSTGKTTIAVQIAANIVRNFPHGFIQYFDLETSQNPTRVLSLARMPMSDLRVKCNLISETIGINEIKEAIMRICLEKKNNPSLYLYDTGLKSEYNEPIIAYEPTVVIIDSIPNLRSDVNTNIKKDVEKLMEVKSQTEQMRLAAEISRFYVELQPWCREYNITIISINQIKKKIDMGIIPTPAEIMYLDRDEALPGGTGPQFQAHVLIKFIGIGSEKYDAKKDAGFEGFGVNAKIIKCRTNQAGISIPMIYDKVRGMDSVRSSVEYAKSIGKLCGNRNGFYFPDHPEAKFTLKNMLNDFRNDRTLYKYLYEAITPDLMTKLSSIEIADVPEEEFDY